MEFKDLSLVYQNQDNLLDELHPFAASYQSAQNLARALANAGFASVQDLKEAGDAGLLAIPGVGPKTLVTIRTAISCYNDKVAMYEFLLKRKVQQRREALDQIMVLQARIKDLDVDIADYAKWLDDHRNGVK